VQPEQGSKAHSRKIRNKENGSETGAARSTDATCLNLSVVAILPARPVRAVAGCSWFRHRDSKSLPGPVGTARKASNSPPQLTLRSARNRVDFTLQSRRRSANLEPILLSARSGVEVRVFNPGNGVREPVAPCSAVMMKRPGAAGGFRDTPARLSWASSRHCEASLGGMEVVYRLPLLNEVLRGHLSRKIGHTKG
jgi:hypothetical protein